MPTRFLSGTPLSQIEFKMQLAPGFRLRGSGLAVRRYTYTPADCDCRYCAEWAERKKTACPVCLYLRERLVAGSVGLNDLRRIPCRREGPASLCGPCGGSVAAALYLLTAKPSL